MLNLFGDILVKLIPLYALVFLGYIGSKKLKIDSKSISTLLIYIILPIVVFNSTYNTEIKTNTLVYPVFMYLISVLVAFLTLKFSALKWKDATKNIVSFNAGTGNQGYLGLPIAIALFSAKESAIFALSVPAVLLYQFTYGVYVMAQGTFSAKESLSKVFKLPLIYAFALGLIFNFIKIDLGDSYRSFAGNAVGAFSILGMMIIGLSLSGLKKLKFDWLFVLVNFFIKFLIWPALMLLIIFIDKSTANFFDEAIYKSMILYAIVPMSANGVVLAEEFKSYPEKTALVVLLSTIFSMIYVPIVAALFLT